MKTISVLDKNTIDKIAAGEVIERPSSIVKELVENAIDAGSNAVTVEIKDGGTTLVRITDNGEGIAPTEVKKAFMRHATSKIMKAEEVLEEDIGFSAGPIQQSMESQQESTGAAETGLPKPPETPRRDQVNPGSDPHPPEPPRPGQPRPNPGPRPPEPSRPPRPLPGIPCDVPFNDGQFTDCRKIKPSDCAMLCKQNGCFCNNRFVIYGYQNFGHLLLCRNHRGQYILGVPGGYSQQERFMANMFGFPYFKECPDIHIPGGKGGYWYSFINV